MITILHFVLYYLENVNLTFHQALLCFHTFSEWLPLRLMVEPMEPGTFVLLYSLQGFLSPPSLYRIPNNLAVRQELFQTHYTLMIISIVIRTAFRSTYPAVLSACAKILDLSFTVGCKCGQVTLTPRIFFSKMETIIITLCGV